MKKIFIVVLVALGMQSMIGNAQEEYYTALCIVDCTPSALVGQFKVIV